ncbi:MAG: hypothetical protein QW812_06295 [Thermoplasmataceae archaeon]
MDEYSLSSRIKQYLRDTFSLRDVLEPIEPLEKSNAEGVHVLAPWELRTICLNSGSSPQFLKQFISRSPDVRVETQTLGGSEVEILKMTGEIKGQVDFEDIGMAPLTVRELMNLYIHSYLKASGSSLKPFKIEEALFNLKNSVFLPDDFMPEHLMGNVEGSLLIPVERLFSEFQISGHQPILYIFPESLGAKFSRIRFLYPAGNVRSSYFTPEKIIDALKNSFSKVSSDPLYSKFEASRLIRTVIFNLNRKKKVEFKPPLFAPEKIKILRQLGVVTDGNVLSQEYDIDSLSRLASRLKEESSGLAKRWLESSL